MGFDSLLGNEALRETLAKSIRQGKLSHFYLLSGPEGSGKHTLAKLIGAAAVCRAEEKPCLRCPACRKVMEGVHPDFITVDDPEKKTVSVNLVREARQDIYIRPNEAEHKVYVFPRAQDLGIEGQNALLKVLEEPPSYGIFLLLADNPERLLPTVRSRCIGLRMQPLRDNVLRTALMQAYPKATKEQLAAAIARSGGFLGQAKALLDSEAALPPQTEALVNAICSGDNAALLQVLVPLEKSKRDALLELMQGWLQLMSEALTVRSGRPGSQFAGRLAAARTDKQLLEAVEHLQKCIRYASSNVSPAAICGYLAWNLR